ncbi:MAG: hypothetical protein SWX82_27570 [Cyanobacteriota bacterium]|nr:hypothetical protein [Cyanobacteriota bacterium]
MTKDFFANIDLSQKTASSYSLPNILIGAAHQLIQLNYNAETQKYQPQVTVNLWESDSHPAINSNFIQVLSDEIIVGTVTNWLPGTDNFPQAKIVKLSRGLEKVKVREFAEIAAITVDGETIFIGTEGKLVSLDRDLEILDEIDLKLPGMFGRGKKNTHDILVYGSVAYLLDNVVEPIYILRVDVSNPSHLQIISKFKIFGTNHHLKRQWLNPSLNQWYILQSYATQAGSGENIITFSMNRSTGSGDFSDSQIPFPFKLNSMASEYLAISDSNFGGSEFEGTKLITVTSLPPNWAVIHDRQEQFYLALINTQNNYIVFDRKVHLGELKDCYLKAEIMPMDKLLFIVLKGSKSNNLFTRLLLIDIAQKPSIILNQDLDELGLNSLSLSHYFCSALTVD